MNSNNPTIEFATSDDWTALDLSAVMRSLDSLYVAVSLANFLGRVNRTRRERFLDRLECSNSPMDFEFFQEWRRFIKRFGPEAFPYWAVPTIGSNNEASTEVEYYLDHVEDFLPPDAELTVSRIIMSSPGGFSLSGLGEPIRELREFIKDIWYRNCQERERGELELVKERLSIAAQMGLTAQQVHVLAVSISSENQDLGRLIQSGKLRLDNESPNVGPPQQRSVTNRRNRKRKGGDKRG